MRTTNNIAIVDADFMFHISEIRKCTPEILKIVESAFETMDIVAMIHPLVYKEELDEKNDVIIAIYDSFVDLYIGS